MSQSTNSHLDVFFSALNQLNLVTSIPSPEGEDIRAAFADSGESIPCWFRRALCFHQNSNCRYFTPACIELFESLVASGLTLQSQWPRSWHASVDAWIGTRFYFATSANMHSATRYASIVSSQIGRNGSRLPSWPRLADAALQQTQLHHDQPLIVHGTSLSEAVEQFSKRAGLEYVQLQTNPPVSTEPNRTEVNAVNAWLVMMLTEAHAAASSNGLDRLKSNLKNQIRLSPPLFSKSSDDVEITENNSEDLRTAPLQDRLALALADRVQVLHVRRSGTIERLLHARLSDQRFPVASVFIASVYSDRKQTINPSSTSELQKWLTKGAVGWLLPELRSDSTIAVCRSRRKYDSLHIQSLYAPMPEWWRSVKDDNWHYLVHCTRGGTGPLPNESLECYWDRIWCRGSIADSSPYEVLFQILEHGKLLGNSKLTRTEEPCVSFSEVPLLQLLERRRFRSHLGRWDWEPFGLLIDRAALRSIGARSVTYGTEEDFRQLPDADKPFFQPLGKSPSSDWASEREWRLLGDLCLRNLPPDSVAVFVDTLHQAQSIARYSHWPVFYRH